MTQPTQAQIEAVAKLLKDALPDILSFDGSIRLADRALTTAAEAAEPTVEQIEARWQRKFGEAVQNIENKAIERCAQVAESIGPREDLWADINVRSIVKQIAAAIRAMKEE